MLRFVLVLLVLASLTLLELTFLEIEDADDPHHSSLRPSRSRARALLHASGGVPKKQAKQVSVPDGVHANSGFQQTRPDG